MSRRTGILSVFVCASAIAIAVLVNVSILQTRGHAATASAQPAGLANATSKEACLDCHGPFDKLVAAANYQAPSGEKITPHRYVPHGAREAKAIPECSNCHEPHPVPPPSTGFVSQSKPDVQWCYTACHHKNTFQPCKDCHK